MRLDPTTNYVTVVCLLLLGPLVASEQFFHTRDRSDNVEFRDLNDRNLVTSKEKAEELLKRYGYLRCSGNNHHRRRGPSHQRHGRHGRRGCGDEEVRKAIKKYQHTYNMPITGRLDVPTLKIMSESRCGNPDDETGAVPFKSMINVRKRHWRKNREYQNLRRQRRSSRYRYAAKSSDSNRLLDYVLFDDRAIIEEETPEKKAIERRNKLYDMHKVHLESGEHDRKREKYHEIVKSRRYRHRKKKRKKKRSTANGVEGHAFVANVVTWRLIGSAYSNQLTINAQRTALYLAFRMWSEVIPLIFQEDTLSPVDDVDILIAFGRGEHMNCPNHFDGFGGQLSHAIKMAASAEIHVDDDEHLTVGSDQGTNLVKVAVHEVGHALGLYHTSRNYSIMYAIYSQVAPKSNFELGWEDRKLVQDIYGVCRLRFNTVFDWVRRRPDGRNIYNTYFFRRHHYWMYENRANRTRYGDPLVIAPEWRGVPDNVDGYVHLWDHIHDMALFFKGDRVWMYNSHEDRVDPGYPKNISEMFGSIPDSHYPSIPGHIDTVFFDKRDGNLYFFKKDLVYAYDVSLGPQGCCLPGYPRPIIDEYPSVNEKSALPSHLDAAYFSYTDKVMYFFKGDKFWENVVFNPMDRRKTNRIIGPYLVSSKWFDICDVDL